MLCDSLYHFHGLVYACDNFCNSYLVFSIVFNGFILLHRSGLLEQRQASMHSSTACARQTTAAGGGEGEEEVAHSNIPGQGTFMLPVPQKVDKTDRAHSRRDRDLAQDQLKGKVGTCVANSVTELMAL